jgi:hypothetical protein
MTIASITEPQETQDRQQPAVTAETWFKAAAVLDSLKAHKLVVTANGDQLSVGPKRWVDDAARRGLRENKAGVLAVLAGVEPEWTVEDCKRVLDIVTAREWLLAPREWVESQWPEIRSHTAWAKHWDLFPFGLRSISAPLGVLFDIIEKNPKDADDIRLFLKLAITKSWLLLRIAYRQAFVSDGGPF